jgi:AraC-like DNA-binding protein
MIGLLRTQDAPPPDRLEYFLNGVSGSIAPYAPRVRLSRDIEAEVLSGAAGAVHVTKVSGPPLRAARTPKLIRASDPDAFKIDLQLRGHTVFAQGGREAALGPGDFTLLDLSRPSDVGDLDTVHEILAVSFAHDALPLHPNELARMTAVPISGASGLGAPISALARHIGVGLPDYGPTEAARLGAALMDLLIVALAERLDRSTSVAADTRRRALLIGVQAFIDRRLADPGLSPGVIAASNHISLRYLHKLFETEATTVASWIRQRRLARCHQDLLDPALMHWPVIAIATRWGFTDAAYFSRAFRAEYGLPPSEFRLARATEPTGEGPIA